MHDKANILADNWAEIFNGEAVAKADIDGYVARHKQAWTAEDLSDVDAAITEDEVAAANKKCKRDKACGPDDLSNEWYQDHADLLVPILTQVFNDCMETGKTPKTF